MIDAAPICWQAIFEYKTPEKNGTFSWHINIRNTNYVLRHGTATIPSGTYKRVVCTNGNKLVRLQAFAKVIKPASIKITFVRWLRK